MVVSLEALYAEHAAGMRRYAASLAGPGAAADITAEAFARVMPVMAGGGQIRDPRAYLAATVRHVAAEVLKARARTWPAGLDRLPEPGGAEAAALDGIDRQVAARAFAGLGYRWRLVLWRTEVEGVPARELAAELGMTPNAVAQVAARAREGLRQSYLAEHMSPRAPAVCRRAAGELAAVVRGHAAARMSGRVTRHLRRCDNCAALAGEMALLNARLGSVLAPIGLGAAGGVARHTVARTAFWKAWTPLAHPLMFGASAVAATASLVYVTAVQPASPQAVQAPLRPDAAVSGPAARASSQPAGPAAAVSTPAAVPPTAAGVTAPAGAATPAAPAGALLPAGLSGVAPAAGHAVAGTTAGLGGAVAGVTGTAGQALGGPAGHAVSGLGSAAGRVVTGAGGAVPALTGAAPVTGGLLGP